jgi:hypothetical protein
MLICAGRLASDASLVQVDRMRGQSTRLGNLARWARGIVRSWLHDAYHHVPLLRKAAALALAAFPGLKSRLGRAIDNEGRLRDGARIAARFVARAPDPHRSTSTLGVAEILRRVDAELRMGNSGRPE